MSTTYATEARKTLGSGRSASVYRLAEVLGRYADDSGLIDRELEALYLEAGSSSEDMSVIGRAGLVEPVDLDGAKRARIVLPEPEPVVQPVVEQRDGLAQPAEDGTHTGPRVTGQDGKSYPVRRGTVAEPRHAPQTGVETREPIDQNDHMWSIINRDAVKGSAAHVALVASMELGAASVHQRKPYAHTTRDLTASYLGYKTGTSESAARTAMTKAVNAGFFVRLDFARGGPEGRGRAEYRATIPAYIEPYGSKPST